MARDPRYDILFEPVPIGPVTARNRFFQVPHCNGMGYRDPRALAAMREVKAEGGWAVVSTEEVEIHPSSDLTPYIEGRLWDEADIPAHALVVEGIHRHGALAAIELVHNGLAAPNLSTRLPPMGPGHQALLPGSTAPVQARRMALDDIADLRRWHRAAVQRSLDAGYDIITVYAGHGLTTLQHFLSPRTNTRTDAYGGSLENRARLLREVLEDTVDAVAGRAAVACRLAVDEMAGDGYGRADVEALLEQIGELPDLWDFMVGEWDDDSVASRFGEEGGHEEHVSGLKRLTTKPVVGVGRFTSPDTMVRMLRQGVLDFIGAARPSIADPFLPRKIEEGRSDEIRECIGCNICVSGDFTSSPIRCTQNPAMGEEWRRGWHPELHVRSERPARVLVVGGGPAGLEAAVAAGKKGHDVVLLEGSRELGGRVLREARLPGLAEWIRVGDYRAGQLARLANVTHYFESTLTADEILDNGFAHVAIATGARWRRDGVGRRHARALPLDPALVVFTPDDVMAGARPEGERVVLYDDDHYYLGGVLAELLAAEGFSVSLVTPEPMVSAWTANTLEQHRIQSRLLELGVSLHTACDVLGGDAAALLVGSVYAGDPVAVPCDAAVLVTARLPNEDLALDLARRREAWANAGLVSMRTVGDAHAPGTIAAAVWDGRRFAEEIDGPADVALFRRSLAAL